MPGRVGVGVDISSNAIALDHPIRAAADRLKLLYNSRMIELKIPGRGTLQLEHLVSDVNGTLAVDGILPDGLPRALNSLRDRLNIHLLTADTHGRQERIDFQLGLKAIRIEPGNEARQKAEYIERLGAERVIAIGQGANDAEMLKTAGLGVCILSVEGTALATLLSADLLVPDIFSALELIEKPLRIVASLRK
jgi:soluble P-type ATPase